MNEGEPAPVLDPTDVGRLHHAGCPALPLLHALGRPARFGIGRKLYHYRPGIDLGPLYRHAPDNPDRSPT